MGIPAVGQEISRPPVSPAPFLPGPSQPRAGVLDDNAPAVPPIQRRFPFRIELKGLVAAGGSASALIEIRGTRLFLKLGEERAIGGGISGEVIFSKLDESEQLHLRFPAEYATVVFREEYNPLGVAPE
jgi:hypothetical protein